ncbi:hypothetical protein FRC07_000340 [Ceratobasidium sp. 392]|nr:hypothetical protein FRC07_000340 [Ceratobasidium sp. 392]
MQQGLSMLANLPRELVVHALQFCDFVDILRFSALVRSTASLQLQIELEANRLLVSGNYAPRDQQEYLESLKRYRDNWLDLRLTLGQDIIRAQHGELFTLWELRGGLFANAYSTTDFQFLQANALQLIPLEDPNSRWNLTFAANFHELTMDPGQDLLVLTIVNETK